MRRVSPALPRGSSNNCSLSAGEESPSTSRRRPVLHFPPPPPYPPDASAMPSFVQPSPGRRRHAPPPPPLLSAEVMHQEYAYAYHETEPPPRRHAVIRSSRHNYISTYGVEENIYEEIAEARGAFENPYEFAERSMNTSGPKYRNLVHEEVRRVQRGHRRVLGELDLAMEALIMPGEEVESAAPPDPDDE
ncbi:hypothetical protein B566_EDAN008892, partial [Ephemera danica]